MLWTEVKSVHPDTESVQFPEHPAGVVKSPYRLRGGYEALTPDVLITRSFRNTELTSTLKSAILVLEKSNRLNPP
jgi:hypothetical protein